MACPFARMPGPKGLPVIGTVLDYGSRGKYSFEKLHEAKMAKYKLYGKIYKEQLAPGVTLVQVFDPEIIGAALRADGQAPLRRTLPLVDVAEKRDKLKCGLGSMNGDEWNRLRTVLQKPMMHPQAATAYLPAQNSVADDFIASIPQHLDANSELDNLSAHLLNYAIEAMGTVCFNSRLGCFNSSSKNAVEGEMRAEQKVIKATSAIFEAVQHTMFSFPWFLLYRTAHYQQFVNSKLLCDSFARHRILDAAERKMKDADPYLPNLLHSLSSNSKEELDIEDAVGLVIDLFISGIDSTANALAFLLYNVACNPDKQQLLYDEIVKQSTLGKPITADTFEQMPYMKACVKESFRLNFPIEGGTNRYFLQDTVLGNYHIPKGITVFFNNQTICLLEEYFNEPAKFVPERWLKGGKNNHKAPPPFVMLPFGYGRRMCIGRRFAEQEIYLALIKIVQAYQLEYHYEKIGMMNRLFTVPDRPIKLKLVSRRAR